MMLHRDELPPHLARLLDDDDEPRPWRDWLVWLAVAIAALLILLAPIQ